MRKIVFLLILGSIVTCSELLMARLIKEKSAASEPARSEPQQQRARSGALGNIHQAAESGNFEALDEFIKAGKVDEQNENKETALHIAARMGRFRVVDLLIAAKADLNLKNRDGDTALQLADKKGRTKIFRKLTEAQETKTTGLPSSQQALEPARSKPPQQRIRSGAPQNIHQAAERGNLGALQRFIDQGNVNDRNENGATPLHRAASLGRPRAAAKLIAAKADVNIRNKFGGTPLHRAAAEGRLIVVDKLIDAKANVHIGNNAGEIALHHAARRGRFKIVEKLIAAGTNVNAQTKEIPGPLLSKEGKPFKEIKKGKKTPLMIAIQKGRIKVVEELLKSKNINLSLPDANGNTALDIVSDGAYVSPFTPPHLRKKLEKIAEMLQVKKVTTDTSEEKSSSWDEEEGDDEEGYFSLLDK